MMLLVWEVQILLLQLFTGNRIFNYEELMILKVSVLLVFLAMED